MPLQPIDHEAYWRLHADHDNADVAAALAEIADRIAADSATFERAPAGRNLVFLGPDVVVKLIPPFWAHMGAREAIALEFVAGMLEVTTPRLLSQGTVGAWTYLVMERLPGVPTGRGMEETDGVDAVGLAAAQGELARSVCDLRPPVGMAMDWRALVAEQRDELDLTGLPPGLAGTAVAYIDEAGDLSRPDDTFLHGDLASINLLTGDPLCLIDWSDAVTGPWEHELISPFMHQFRGRAPLIDAFWGRYGALDDPEQTQHRAMARSILKYATLLPRYLADLPGDLPQTWDEAASRFYRLA